MPHSHFQLSAIIPKPSNQTEGKNTPVNQSKLEANACSRQEMRGKCASDSQLVLVLLPISLEVARVYKPTTKRK